MTTISLFPPATRTASNAIPVVSDFAWRLRLSSGFEPHWSISRVLICSMLFMDSSGNDEPKVARDRGITGTGNFIEKHPDFAEKYSDKYEHHLFSHPSSFGSGILARNST